MRFSTEAARLAHPHAGLITGLIWNSSEFFQGGPISDTELQIMRLDLSTMRAPEESLRWSSSEQIKCCLCLLLGHPDATSTELLTATELFSLPPVVIAQAALLSNRLDILKLMYLTIPVLTPILAADHFLAFRSAAFYGHLDVLMWHKANAPEKFQSMIMAKKYYAFRHAAKNGRLPVLEWLKEHAPEKLHIMIAAQSYEAFRFAALNGHLQVLKWLRLNAPDKFKSMIAAQNYDVFSCAALNGHLLVLKWLKESASEKFQAMIKAQYSFAFRYAARNGHLDVLIWLKEEVPHKVQAAIETQSYDAFRYAARNGHLDVLVWLKNQALPKFQAMLTAEHFDAFCSAAANGQLPSLKWLKEQAPDKFKAMIKAQSYAAFRNAARNGHLEVLQWLKEQEPAEFEAMMSSDHYAPFRSAASSGHLKVLQWLKEQAPEKLQTMIAAQNHDAFNSAASNGHLNLLKWFKIEASEQWHSMLTAPGYKAFRYAATNGHLEVLLLLKSEIPEHWHAMVSARGYEAFRAAAEKNHRVIIDFLFSTSDCFAYAEMRDPQYKDIIHKHISKQLSALHEEFSAFMPASVASVFDIRDLEQAKICFYMIRNLIRRNDASVLAEIHFLLQIPGVKSLAHTEVTLGQANELLRLALRINNPAAVELLLAIPAVRELAEHNEYYHVELQSGPDLAVLAQDHESSMHTLTPSEQLQLTGALEHYEPIVGSAGVDALFTHLLEELVFRYELNPAVISLNGIKTVLPVSWEAFTNLHLNPIEQKAALKAYYQNKDHTALRYLSCPNPWIAEDALFVHNNILTGARWSSFEEYKSLIIICWLAAQDKSIPLIDDHTVEGRLNHFIDELAHLGRAHNWDHTRIKKANNGSFMLDAEGLPIQEEYDDLEGDKPSCYPGIKRRLFQSVIGHPLFKILTNEDIKQELRDFVRNHFKSLITDANRVLLMNAWTTYCVTLEVSDAAPLRLLDLNERQKEQFSNQLLEKYGAQFAENSVFKRTIEKEFTLIENPRVPSDCMHALKFAALINLEQLLRPTTVHIPSTARDLGLFAGGREIANRNDSLVHGCCCIM